MSDNRLTTPVGKGLTNGYNTFFLHGPSVNDCFYYNFQMGTLSSHGTFQHAFLTDTAMGIENFIYIKTNTIKCYSKAPNDTIIEDYDKFFAVKQDEDVFGSDDGASSAAGTIVSDDAKKIQADAETNHTEFQNCIRLLCEKIREKESKVAVYFDEFEWVAGLYSSDTDGALPFVKLVKDLSTVPNAITVVNIRDLDLLKKYHFETEDSNTIYVGTPSALEVKAAFFRKYMNEYDLKTPIQTDLLSQLDDIAHALASSNKDLRASLRVYREIMSKIPDKKVDKKAFEIAVENILDEKVTLADVVLDEYTKQMINTSIDTFLESDDSKNYRKGIILTGPPGTGKTFLAKALANEKNCFFMAPTLSDLKGEFVGQSSAKVKRVFDQARANQPTVLFIDEADTVFADRNLAGSTSDSFNLDMVNQFLVEIDGMKSGSQKIYIIAATNRVQMIDSAIKNRLSEVVEIPLPKKQERKDLFDLKLQHHGFKFKGSKFSDGIVDKTENMSGRDIDNFVKKLCEEVINTKYRTLKNLSDNDDTRGLFFKVLKSSEDELVADMQRKIPLEIKLPSEIQDTYDDIIGYGRIKESIDRQMEAITSDPDKRRRAEQFGIHPSRGLLLYGPPGNAKTKLAEACAKKNNLYLIKVLSKDFSASTLDKQLKNLQLIFDQAIQLSKMCIDPQGVLLFFDEVDALASNNVLTSVVRGTLLDYLSNENGGIRDKYSKVAIMAATNFYESLDEAVIRKGRIDEHCFMDNPSETEGQDILMQCIEKDFCVYNVPLEDSRKIYTKFVTQIRVNKLSKEMDVLRLGRTTQEVEDMRRLIEEKINKARPSGAEIMDLFHRLKAEAYYKNAMMEDQLIFTDEVVESVIASDKVS